eukprot:364830-Chlamydomonas_euryale.AAC.4
MCLLNLTNASNAAMRSDRAGSPGGYRPGPPPRSPPRRSDDRRGQRLSVDFTPNERPFHVHLRDCVSGARCIWARHAPYPACAMAPCPRAPTRWGERRMLTFKEFLMDQADDPGPEEAHARYAAYQVSFHGGEIKAEFVQRKDDDQ